MSAEASTKAEGGWNNFKITFMKPRFSGEGPDKEAAMLPEVPPEIARIIIGRAIMDAEVYLADLHAHNPAGPPREPTEGEVLSHRATYDADRTEKNLLNMNEQEIQEYELAFRRRFAEGYQKMPIN